MKKPVTIAAILISITILLAILCQGLYIQETTCIEQTRFVFAVDDSLTEQVSLHTVDGNYYAFLPAYADLATTKISVRNGYSLFIDGEEYSNSSNCAALTYDHEYPLVIKNSLGLAVSKARLIIKKADHIPTLSLHLSDGTLESLQTDKNVSKSGTALLVTENNNIDYLGAFRALHGRGNSTWTQPKKSFSLSFDAATDLLGMGESTTWVLMANSLDESSLRNKLVYDTAEAMGLPYACRSNYINLYVDNEYQGLYLLAERVDVGVNRVNITNLQENTQAVNQLLLSNYPQVEKTTDGKIQRGYDIVNNPSDISGGYLLQIEHHDTRIAAADSLIQTDALSLALSCPKYASREQIAYIAGYMNTIESQIKAGDLSGIDIDSFALLYLLQEFFANSDNCSIFFYKDSDQTDGRLFAGPVWDFDLSMGNGFLDSDTRSDLLYRNNDNWMNYLLDCEPFTACLKKRYWDAFRPNMETLIDQKLQEYHSEIEASFHMDKLRWKDVDRYNDWGNTCQKRFDTLDEHIARIRTFLNDRTAYLDIIWGQQEGYCLLSFFSEKDGYRKTFYVKEQDVLSSSPNPVSEKNAHNRFVGWFDDEGNEFDPNLPVLQDASYTARWEKAESNTANQASFPQLDQIISSVSSEALLIGAVCAAVIGFLAADIVRGIRRKRYKNDQ